MELNELMAKDQIRDVIHRYCRAVDRCDVELMKSCYHPDAMDNHGFFSGTGHDFADYVIPKLRELDFSVHSITNTMIEVEGDRAFVESQWSVIHRMRRFFLLTDMWHQGRYLDLFEKREGQWKILKRVSITDADRWLPAVNLAGLLPRNSPYLSVLGKRFPDDLSYRKKDFLSLEVKKLPLFQQLWLPMKVLISTPIWLLNLFSKRR